MCDSLSAGVEAASFEGHIGGGTLFDLLSSELHAADSSSF